MIFWFASDLVEDIAFAFLRRGKNKNMVLVICFLKRSARVRENIFFIEIFLFSLKHTFSMANQIREKHDSKTLDANLTDSHNSDPGANNRS